MKHYFILVLVTLVRPLAVTEYAIFGQFVSWSDRSKIDSPTLGSSFHNVVRNFHESLGYKQKQGN